MCCSHFFLLQFSAILRTHGTLLIGLSGLYSLTQRGNISTWMVIHCKVLRRMHIWCTLQWFAPLMQAHSIVWFLLFSWAIVDVSRYSFYALNTFRVCPEWLVSLRYSEFLVTYPFGLLVEMSLWGLMLFSANINNVQDMSIIVPMYTIVCIGYLCWRLVNFPRNFYWMLVEMKNRTEKSK